MSLSSPEAEHEVLVVSGAVVEVVVRVAGYAVATFLANGPGDPLQDLVRVRVAVRLAHPWRRVGALVGETVADPDVEDVAAAGRRRLAGGRRRRGCRRRSGCRLRRRPVLRLRGAAGVA